MKKQLQQKLTDYKDNLSEVAFDPAATGRFGLASTAALAAMMAAPVELGAQTVCGEFGAPIETPNSMRGDDFDLDGDGINEIEGLYYTPGVPGYFGPQVRIPIVAAEAGYLGLSGNTSYPASPNSLVTPTILIVDQNSILFLQLSGGGYGFLSFDSSSGSPKISAWGGVRDITTLSEISIATNSVTDCPAQFAVALPVEFTSLDAVAQPKSIRLNWATATETANAGFEIERSTDGENFRVLEFVAGQGDATETNNYTFEDEEVIAGNEYFYRLKQINFDGSFQYSEVVSAELLQAGLQASIFPNPITGGHAQLRVSAASDEDVTITVFSGNGQRMSVATQAVESGSNRLTLDLNGLSVGIYFVKLEQAGATTYEKVVVE